ncbi:MAG: hypothetical protein Q8L24_00795 [bacterium]|nr:hypothetical protein [bacterium]
MKIVLLAMFCLFACSIVKSEDPKPEETKKPIVCWESVELYDDSDFEEKMDEDSSAAKNFRKKMPKYETEVKQEALKVLIDRGVELVECPDHTFDGSGLRRVGADEKPLHMRMSFAYDGFIEITGYVKVEVFDGDNKIITFKRQKSASIFTLLSREKRRAVIMQFGREVMIDLAARVVEWKAKQK